MTRKQRGQGGNTTYNLSNPRNVAAFEALLEEEDVEDIGKQSRASQQLPPSGRKKREKEKFFKLKSEDARASNIISNTTLHQQSHGTLQHLQDMFRETADPSVIVDVYQAVGSNFEAAVETLLGLLGSTDNASHPSSSSSGAGTGGDASSSAAAYISNPSSNSSPAGALHWSQLPDDIKTSILSHLPLRELARIAHACREFHARCSNLRNQVYHLKLPPGLSYSAIVGMICSYTSASVVDLSRLEQRPARNTPARQQRQELPQVVVMQKQEAEAELFRALMAVAEAAAAQRRQQAAMKGLVLKGLIGATDRLLAEALQQLKGLRSIDVSHCSCLTNKSLYQLAKYQVSPELQWEQHQDQEVEPGSYDDDDEVQQWEDPEDWMLSEDTEDGHQSSSSSSSDTGDVSGGADEESRQAEPEEPEGTDRQLQGGQQPEQVPADEPWPAPEQPEDEEAQLPGDTPAEVGAGSSSHSGDVDLQVAHDLQDHPASRPAGPRLPTTALAAAVADRMALLQVRSTQQAAAAAATAAAASRNAAGLHELRLCGGRAFADDGLRQLLQGPVTKHSLTKLDVSRCPGFSQAGLIVPPLGVLHELRASHCKGLTQLVIHLPASHPLALLDLSGCHYLKLVDLAVKGLQQLNLSACRTLYRLRVRCPGLKTLSLAQCGMLHDFHADAWQVPALEQLNLFGCRRASGQMLQAVLQQMPNLLWLNLNGCWSIHSLHLTANLQLAWCDLTGCRNLVEFSSSSTALRQLQAASCGRLYSLTLASAQLQKLILTNCSALSDVHTVGSATMGSCNSTVPSWQRQEGQQLQGEWKAGGKGRRALAALDIKGCSTLSAVAAAKLAAVMAA